MLRNRWYPILEARKLRKKSIGIKRFGLSLVLWRDLDHEPRLLPATCPHRGASLEYVRTFAAGLGQRSDADELTGRALSPMAILRESALMC